MRSKLPIFWIFQLAILVCLSMTSLFSPISVLEFYRGQRAPKEVEKPAEALYGWVLGLEMLPPPNDTVREFFRNHEGVAYEEEKIWTPSDPSLAKFRRKSKSPQPHSVEMENSAWEEMEDWLMSGTSGQPLPSPADLQAVRAWLDSINEIPEPSSELCRQIANQEGPQPPPKELRMMILEARSTQPIAWQLSSDLVRLAAPCSMTAALFTLLGLFSSSIRRPLARIFVMVALFWTVARLKSSLGPADWNLAFGVVVGGFVFGLAMIVTAVRATPRMNTGATLFLVITAWWTAVVAVAAFAQHENMITLSRVDIVAANALVAIIGIMNAYYWLIGKSEDPPQDDAGIAQRRPPQLWTIWLLQFTFLWVNGLLALAFPDWIAELFVHAHYDYLASDIVDDAVRILGGWIIAMSLFSYFALGVGHDWIWQGISVIFCVAFIALASITGACVASGEYTIWAYLYGFQGIVFIPVTVILLMQKDPWSTEIVERIRDDDWNLTDVLVGPVLMRRAFFFGRRALYGHGVGARGHLRILHAPVSDGNGRPDSEFFVPGRQFPVQMRYANRTQKDDASLDIRGCGLRLSCGPGSPLDLMFATGAFAPMSSLLDFRRSLPFHNLKRIVLKHKVVREGLAAGMRRAPASFADLTFYHQFVFGWLTPDAQNYLVRFRLIPAPVTETVQDTNAASLLGLPDREDLQHLWEQKRRSDETRSTDYLRRELHDRLAGGARITLHLEMQFHRPDRGDSLDWYDAALEWDTQACPWHPLAEVILSEPLTVEESEGLRIDPSNLPSCLNVPHPANLANLEDPRALAAARHRIARALGRLRTWRRPPPASLHAGSETKGSGGEGETIDQQSKPLAES